MKNILLIGIGGTGSEVLDILNQKMEELGNQTENRIRTLAFVLGTKTYHTPTIDMATGQTITQIYQSLGDIGLDEWMQYDELKKNCSGMPREEMLTYFGRIWRKKGYLAFIHTMNRVEQYTYFNQILEETAILEPGSTCEIYIVSSIAGATGSGALIPIALYAKRYIRRVLGITPAVYGMLVCPDIYAERSTSADSATKMYANAYATIRELNAINTVARGGCNDANRKKNIPFSFRIGSEKEPKLGVLFDSDDPQYWKPEAAPFDKIYILDRIPGTTSIPAHQIVLADSLHTLICTSVGDSIDTEASNHMTLMSQNNGSGAIFAGISTAQIRFPISAVLDFLAKERTLHTCEGQWLQLHYAVSEKIQEKRREYREKREIFVLDEKTYAELTIQALKELEEADSGVMEIINRWTAAPTSYEDNLSSQAGQTVDEYFEDLYQTVSRRAFSTSDPAGDYKRKIESYVRNKKEAVVHRFPLIGEVYAADWDSVVETAKACNKTVTAYYRDCMQACNDRASGITDAILTFDANKDPGDNKELSLLQRLLIKDGRYMHPVAALAQLCRLRNRITEYFSDLEERKSRAGTVRHLQQFEREEVVPQEFYCASDKVAVPMARKKRSRYYLLAKKHKEELERDLPQRRAGKNMPLNWRLPYFLSCEKDYLEKRSDEDTDVLLIKADALATLQNIEAIARDDLMEAVFKRVCTRLDQLIRHYRNFFERFSEEKSVAAEEAEIAHRRDASYQGSVFNVFSSPEQKTAIMRKVLGETDVERLEDVLRSDNMAGTRVWEIVLNSIRKENDDFDHFNDDRGMISRLLEGMNEENRRVVRQNVEFKRLANMSVLEAIEESCQNISTQPQELRRQIADALKRVFAITVDLATPSLTLEEKDCDENNAITPSDVYRVLMPIRMAEHIKKNAVFYEIDLPDDPNESAVLQACAEEFAHRYIFPTGRILIVPSLPNNVLYITGEKMDITPTRISKFNEMGRVPGYYRHYTDALARMTVYETDLWNPHLGNGWHRRVSLPYLNPQMEQRIDEDIGRALLYAFLNKEYRYCPKKEGFWHKENGENQWLQYESQTAGRTTPFLLCHILRQDEYLAKEWGDALSQSALQARLALPPIHSDSDVSNFLTQFGKIPFMKALCKNLYTCEEFQTQKPRKKKEDAIGEEAALATAPEETAVQEKSKKEATPGILEFSYWVKCAEETHRDCNDAEKLLRAAFAVVKEICFPQELLRSHPETALLTYRDQLDHILESFYQRCAEIHLVADKEEKVATAEKDFEKRKGADKKLIPAFAQSLAELTEKQKEVVKALSKVKTVEEANLKELTASITELKKQWSAIEDAMGQWDAADEKVQTLSKSVNALPKLWKPIERGLKKLKDEEKADFLAFADRFGVLQKQWDEIEEQCKLIKKEAQKVASAKEKWQNAKNDADQYFKRVVAWANRIDTFGVAELTFEYSHRTLTFRPFHNPVDWKKELR